MAYCNWGGSSDLNQIYHDREWGIPVHDDRTQFEYLMMEVMQCGLSWSLMIKKREIFRACFDNFEFDLIAKYDENDIKRILETDGMIKSRRKIEAIINNAQCFQKIREQFGSFCNYLWGYSDNKTILYNKHELGYIPVSNWLSEMISKDLKKRGLKYMGAITVYSHLQAAGIINDHDKNCPRYEYINSHYQTVRKNRFKEKGVTFFGDK